MTKTDLTRRGALLGAAGASLTVAACSGQQPEPMVVSDTGTPFKHGVASGDPDQSSVMLWTAITEDGGGYRGVQVATDREFTNVVFEAGDDIAYVMPQPLGTWKYLATGLEAGRTYFYRFRLNDIFSPTGVTQTLPDGDVDSFNIGVFSCSNFPAGHFNVYGAAAQMAGLDLVLHLGDYIYEYARDGYATGNAEALNRVSVPAHEIVSYQDYVERHAQYKSDPDLQLLHASVPWIMTWDDHESSNDSYTDGAENHDESEGPWEVRRDAALRAWYDWTPSREPDDLRHRWGTYQIGNLATLVMIESRLTARDVQVDLSSFPVEADADDSDPEVLAAVERWKTEIIGDESRELLGREQIDYVADAFGASVEAGTPWRILGNQIIMSRVNFPDFSTEMPGWLRWFATRDNEFARQFITRTRFGIPFGLDMWDGYPAERDRLYSALNAVNADIITVTGDVHSFWTNDLIDREGHRMGTEFVTAAVTSPTPFSSFAAPGVDYGRMLVEANAEVQHCNMEDQGFIRLHLTPERLRADYYRVSTILSRDYDVVTESAWEIERGPLGTAPDVQQVV